MKCRVCNTVKTGHLVDAGEQAGVYCCSCAGETIKALFRQRYSLADALGHDTGAAVGTHAWRPTPTFKELVKQVKGLVEEREELNRFRAFMRRAM